MIITCVIKFQKFTKFKAVLMIYEKKKSFYYLKIDNDSNKKY